MTKPALIKIAGAVKENSYAYALTPLEIMLLGLEEGQKTVVPTGAK
jgi:hypothetical protein